MKLKILASHPVQYHVPFFRALVSAGIDVDVLFFHRGSAGRAVVDPEFGIALEWDMDLLSGYSSQFLENASPAGGIRHWLRILPRLLGWVLRDRKTPVLLVSWSQQAMWLAWAVRCLGGWPVMVLSETTPESYAASPKPLWRVKLLSYLLRHTQAAFYIGKKNRCFYEQMGVRPEHLFAAPYSVENDRFSSEAARLMPRQRELRTTRGLDPDLPAFLFCGKLVSNKRPLQLLNAYVDAGLSDVAQLVFVGEGALRPEIEAAVSERQLKNVHLVGFLNQSEMPLAYVLGDLLCLISGQETWGLVVNEAMSCGLPVLVTSTVGCWPDLVQAGNGWTVSLEQHEQLVEALRRAYSERTSWRTMGAESRAIVSHYTYEAMARSVSDAMSRIVKRSSNRRQLSRLRL